MVKHQVKAVYAMYVKAQKDELKHCSAVNSQLIWF